MVFYADYEALEFNNRAACRANIYPYYLDPNITETSLCPIYFSACNQKSEIIFKQNCYDHKISFITFLDKIVNKYRNIEPKIHFVWFHNVQYDFRIIAHELFYNSFKQCFDNEHIEYQSNIRVPADRTFSIVGQSLSKYVGINVYYRGFKIMIRDTMRILNSSQDKILKDFGYPKKTDVKWETINIKNLKDNMPLIEQRNIYDIQSLSKCLEEFKATFKEHFHGKGSTAAGMSLDALKHYLCEVTGVQEINHETKDDNFKNIYPPLSGLNSRLSKGCYGGGICTVNKELQGQVLYHLQMVDINSSYPYSMTLPLPYGEGVEMEGFSDEGYSEYVVFVSFAHRGIPFQRCNSENIARELVGLSPKETIYTRSQFPNKYEGYLCINSVDLATLKRHATISCLEFKKGVNYKTNTVIADFIRPLYAERKKSGRVLNLAIKLLLNSLYGKYAQDLSGLVYNYENINDYEKIVAIDKDTIYKPLASAVTAYSRQNLINTMYLLGEDFIYCDTDSLYFKNPEKNVKILDDAGLLDDNELGKWGFDKKYGGVIVKGKFLSKKNYVIELSDDRDINEYKSPIKVTCVGLSHKYHDQVTFDNFIIGSSPFNIQKMVNIYGGKAMRNTEFKIKERTLY